MDAEQKPDWAALYRRLEALDQQIAQLENFLRGGAITRAPDKLATAARSEVEALQDVALQGEKLEHAREDAVAARCAELARLVEGAADCLPETPTPEEFAENPGALDAGLCAVGDRLKSLGRELLRPLELVPVEECPGRGQCHGSLSHCRRCGDVALLCNMGTRCDVHRERWRDAVLDMSEETKRAYQRGHGEGRAEAENTWREEREQLTRRATQAEARASTAEWEGDSAQALLSGALVLLGWDRKGDAVEWARQAAHALAPFQRVAAVLSLRGRRGDTASPISDEVIQWSATHGGSHAEVTMAAARRLLALFGLPACRCRGYDSAHARTCPRWGVDWLERPWVAPSLERALRVGSIDLVPGAEFIEMHGHTLGPDGQVLDPEGVLPVLGELDGDPMVGRLKQLLTALADFHRARGHWPTQEQVAHRLGWGDAEVHGPLMTLLAAHVVQRDWGSPSGTAEPAAYALTFLAWHYLRTEQGQADNAKREG